MENKINKFVELNVYKSGGHLCFPRQEYGFVVGRDEIGVSLPISELVTIERDDQYIEVNATFMDAHTEGDTIYASYKFEVVQ